MGCEKQILFTFTVWQYRFKHGLSKKPDSEYWPDPFDDFEACKAALQAEQKKLPQAVRFMDKQVGGGV